MSDAVQDPVTTLSHRPTVAVVDLDALKFNFEAIRAFVSPSQVMPVVKANAYGHGLVTCGKFLEVIGAKSLGVAYLEEGIELRKAGVRVPILVFGGLLSSQVDQYISSGLDITAPSVHKLELINEVAERLGKKARVHLKIDTGLERLGVHYYSAETLFDAALRASHCEVVGVFSHFAAVDRSDLTFSKLQLERFQEAVRPFEERYQGKFVRHLAASAGLLTLPESRLDMVRPGLSLYGVYPSTDYRDLLNLEPVLALKSHVVYFKVTKAGSGVSYGLTWMAPKDTRIVTIPVGYGDGLSRQLSNRGSVLIRGHRYPIVGSVCMDQLMVDIGDGEAYNGDEVVFFGSQGNETISVEEVAKAANTIPWEVIVSLNQRVPRTYVGG